jgi:hypothetical protein
MFADPDDRAQDAKHDAREVHASDAVQRDRVHATDLSPDQWAPPSATQEQRFRAAPADRRDREQPFERLVRPLERSAELREERREKPERLQA